MSSALQFDEATSRRVEATYRTPDVVGQRRMVLAALDLKPGEDVLDIGSGPGFLACEMSKQVGPDGSVTGIEPSESMLSIARARSCPADSAPVDFRPGEATALPGTEGSFDAVTSTQVYEYVEDVPAALAEASRVLRPGGRLLVLGAWDKHLADPYLPRRLTGLLEDAGFSVTHRSAVPLLNVGYGILFSLNPTCSSPSRTRPAQTVSAAAVQAAVAAGRGRVLAGGELPSVDDAARRHRQPDQLST